MVEAWHRFLAPPFSHSNRAWGTTKGVNCFTPYSCLLERSGLLSANGAESRRPDCFTSTANADSVGSATDFAMGLLKHSTISWQG